MVTRLRTEDILRRREETDRRRADAARESRDKQMVAVQMLSGGATPTEVCAATGIGRETLYRWMAHPLFERELVAARSAMAKMARTALDGRACDAVEVLCDIMRDREVTARVRVVAAEAILSRASWLEDRVELRSETAPPLEEEPRPDALAAVDRLADRLIAAERGRR